jgi:hypothetical protein
MEIGEHWSIRVLTGSSMRNVDLLCKPICAVSHLIGSVHGSAHAVEFGT